jgi:hypothetical protein
MKCGDDAEADRGISCGVSQSRRPHTQLRSRSWASEPWTATYRPSKEHLVPGNERRRATGGFLHGGTFNGALHVSRLRCLEPSGRLGSGLDPSNGGWATFRMWPVMNLASSDAMNTMPSATSSERPSRPSGTCVARAALFCAVPVKRVSMPVSVGPGATAFTRIPDLASSSATYLV